MTSRFIRLIWCRIASRWSFTIDARARPKTWDATRQDVPGALNCRLIYTLEGGTLTMFKGQGFQEWEEPYEENE